MRQLAGMGFTALLASRDPDKGRAAAGALADQDLEVDAPQLEVADADSVRAPCLRSTAIMGAWTFL